MLQRSLWSSLFLSAAVASSLGLALTRISCAQDSAPAAAASAPASAAAAVPLDANKLATLADDVLHYSLVNNNELAQANAEAIIAAGNAPEDVLKAFEASSNGRNCRDILVAGQRRPELKDAAAKLIDIIDEGAHRVARDPVRIRADIDRLNGGPRAYLNAKDRLAAAGQFSVPIFLEYLQNNSKKDLHAMIIRVMGEIGRPLLLPLIVELRVADPTLRVELINVVGQIGYPQALPALRAMQLDEKTTPEMKAAIDTAINRIDPTGQASKMSPAELCLAGGENFYNMKPSYLPALPDEKTNPVWYFDSNMNNVMPVQVPTEIWNSVMALRMAENALKLDPTNAGAISLWLAADLRREILLPAGAADPSRPAAAQTADFYARAAGPAYINPVLTRALDNNDPALALRAIAALEATGGVSGLVSSADSPLVRALGHPDRAVRFHAAFALARANPLSQFPSFFRVVPILSEAVGTSATPAALLVIPNVDLRNAVSEALHSSDAHFTVYAGETVSAALEQARKAPAFDVVLVPFMGTEMNRLGDLARVDYRLTNVPVLVAAPAAELANARIAVQSRKGYQVVDDRADEAALSAALTQARADIGAAPLSAQDANDFALTALKLLDSLAADHRSIYSVNEAASVVIDALRDKRPDVVTTAAGVLGKLNNPDAQRALAAAALYADAPAEMRISFFTQLGESAKRTANSLDASAINALIRTVGTDPDVKVRFAAAGALGALNVPSNQASSLILQQAR
jgi:hypothetical protein